MVLNLQIYSLIFSFLYGIFLYYILKVDKKILLINNLVLKIIINLILIIIISILYFIILLYINNAYIHFYLYLSIILGYILCYIFEKRSSVCQIF